MNLIKLAPYMPTPSYADLNEDLLVSSYAYFMETNDAENRQLDSKTTSPLPRLWQEVARPVEL